MNKMFQWFAQAWTFFCMGTAIGFGLGACSVRTVEDPKGAPAKAAAAKDTGKPSPTPDGTDTAKTETTTPTDPSLGASGRGSFGRAFRCPLPRSFRQTRG